MGCGTGTVRADVRERGPLSRDAQYYYPFLGPFPEVEVDIFVEPVEEGDALVLCSDGLSGMVSDHEITSIVENFGPQESVYRLVECANEQGGIDNITTIVARVHQRT